MKKKLRFSVEEQIDSFSHMKFTAMIMIDGKIVNFETLYFEKLDYATENTIELLKRKYNDMYLDLLNYREKYKLETMSVSLDFITSHNVDNLPV